MKRKIKGLFELLMIVCMLAFIVCIAATPVLLFMGFWMKSLATFIGIPFSFALAAIFQFFHKHY